MENEFRILEIRLNMREIETESGQQTCWREEFAKCGWREWRSKIKREKPGKFVSIPGQVRLQEE